MKLMKRIGVMIANELRRPSVWDEGWRIVLLSGIAINATMAILLVKELLG